MHVGIDYGSKLAGTTAIAYNGDKGLTILQSIKNKDADAFILDHLININARTVYLDAPLSIPAAYYGTGDDYFYRACDRELKAMSPMFLGGLTARAMKLKAQLMTIGIKVVETYPKALVYHHPSLKILYSKKELSGIADFMGALEQLYPYALPVVNNWHQVDAVLAWCSGNRHETNQSIKVGNPAEGIIIY